MQFEASVLFADQLVPHGELEILEADTPYYVYLLWPGMTLSSIGWMFRSLDDLQPTQWLLGNSPEEDNPGAVGYGYQFEYIGNPPSGPPYTEFFEGNGGEQFYSGFAVFPSRNYIVGGFSPQFPSPDPDPGNADPGTTIILFKAGIKGCIALHAYDSTRTVLQPADPR